MIKNRTSMTHLRKTAALAVLLAAVTAASIVPAGAQSPTPAQTQAPAPVSTGEPAPAPPQNAQIGLKVAPSRYTGTIAPGESKEGVVDLFNVGRQRLRVRGTFENVRMTGDDGALESY
ncbi:MAG: hypothetical protein M3N59_01655, partial [bacterium]|nr:hypothetical protein [bacterium]